MSNSIEEAIKAAEAAGTQATATALAEVTPVNNSIAVAGTPRRITVEDRTGSSMAVDHFVKFTSGGRVQIGTSITDVVDKVRVYLTLSEVEAAFGISYEDASGALHYVRTVDTVSTTEGGSWAEEVAKGRRIKPSLKPYNAWAVPMILKADTASAKAGARLGYTLSYTASQEFLPMFDKAVKQFGLDTTIELELSSDVTQNANKKVYGLAKFAFIGEVIPDDAE